MFNKGRAHFRSRYVQTSGFVMESKAKRLIFKGMMGTKPPKSEKGDPLYTFKVNQLTECETLTDRTHFFYY
jgi:carotenoid cleavage dioxygenase-like enzyme